MDLIYFFEDFPVGFMRFFIWRNITPSKYLERQVRSMQHQKIISLDLLTAEANPQNSLQSAAVINNRLEALKVLSNSLLYELESLKMEEKTHVTDGKIDLAFEVSRFEKDLIRTALSRTGGRQRPAARLLGVKVTTLHAKIKRYGLQAASAF